MKWLKRLVLGLALLLIAAIAALLIVNPNQYKPLIEHAVSETTDRTLSLDGDLSLTWFPSLGLELGPTRLGNPPGFGDSPFARIERAVLRVEFLPLLQGALGVQELEIRGLTLNLQVDDEGRTNWRDLVLLFASESEQSSGASLPVTLAGITVEDAALHFNDAVTDLDFSIAPIGFTTGPIVLGEPVDLALELDASSTTPPVDAHIRVETTSRIDPGPVLTLADLKAAFSAEGEGLPLTLKEGQIAGTVAVDLNERTVSVTPLEGVVVAASPRGVEFQIASTATGNGNLNTYRFSLSDLRVNLDATGLPLADRWFSGSLASAIAVDGVAKKVTIDRSRLEMRGEGSRGEDVELSVEGGGDIDLARHGVNFEGLTATLDAFGVPLGEEALTGRLTTDVTGELDGSGITVGPISLVLQGKGDGGLASDLRLNGTGYVGPGEGTPFTAKLALESALRGGTPDLGESRGRLDCKLAGELADGQILVYPIDGKLTHTAPDGKTTRAALSGNGKIDLQAQTLNLEEIRLDVKARDGIAGLGGLSGELRAAVSAGMNQALIEFGAVEAKLRGSIADGAIFAVRAAGDGRFDPKAQAVKFEDLGLRLRAAGGTLPAGSLEVSARTGLDADLAEGKATMEPVEIEWSGIKADGRILTAGLKDTPAAFGSLMIHPFSPRQVLASLGHPVTPATPDQILGSGAGLLEFQATAKRIVLPRFELALDDSRLNGKLSVEPGEPASIVMLTHLDRIDLDPYLAALAQPEPTESESPDTANAAFEAMGELLNAIELKGTMDIGELTIGGTTATGISATLRSSEGVLDARPVSASIYEGRARGLFSLDARETEPRFSLHTEATGVALGNLIADALGEGAATLEGRGSLRLNLQTRGTNVSAITRHLQGSIRTEIKRGALRDKALAAKIEILMAVLRARKPRPPEERILFDLLTGTWTMDKGVISNDDLRFDLPIASFRGKGAIDLNENRIDYALYPLLPGRERDLWLAPITIRGPLADPNYGLDVTRFTREAPQP